MKQIALSYFPAPWLTALGLLIFFTLFSAVIAWTYFVRSPREIEATSMLVLSDESENQNV